MSKLKTPRVSLIDIETSPIMGYSWEAFDTNVLKIIENSKIISVSWKFLGDTEVYCKCLNDYKGYKKGEIDDRRLIEEVWKILDESDVCIAHNGNSFDFKKLYARFIYHDLPAPSSFKTVDTCTSARKYFKFDSNSLNNLAEYLGLGSKINNGGFSLWLQCFAGDKDAWSRMKDYNKQDVVLLEKVYLKLRPYLANHPNLALLNEDLQNIQACPACQSTSVMKRGFSITKTGRKQRLQCSDCGSWSLGPFTKVKNALSVEDE